MSTSIALQITGDNLDPDEVSHTLQVEPTSARRKGEVRRSHDGAEVTAKFGLWRWKLPLNEIALDDNIQTVIDAFPEFATKIKGIRGCEQVWMDICVIEGSEVEVPELLFSPNSISSIAAMGIPLSISVYTNVDD